MKLHNKNRTSDEPNALAPGADKSEDVRAAEAFGDERLQASLREARGEDDPRGLAWIEEVREAWWRKRLAWLPGPAVDAFLRARRPSLRATSRLSSVCRRRSGEG